MSDTRPVRRAASLEPVEMSDPQATNNPTLLVPAAVRVDLARLWACNAHLFPNQLPLFATVRDYLDQGLPVEAVPGIVRRLLAAERRANHRFASDLLTDLAALVADVLRCRQRDLDVQARRERHRADQAGAAGAGVVRDLLASFGETFGEVPD